MPDPVPNLTQEKPAVATPNPTAPNPNPTSPPPNPDPAAVKTTIYQDMGVDDPGKANSSSWPSTWREDMLKGTENPKAADVLKRYQSPALIADGRHVISDFWTSAGAVVGLLLVKLTNEAWIDSATAILFALLLFWTGGRLLRESARGLLDETDPILIDELCTALERSRAPGVIEVHDLRAINVGGSRHVDLHIVVPEFWTVEEAHTRMDAYERRVHADLPRAELQFHVDPCERAYCQRCDLADCAVRQAPLAARRAIVAATALRGPEPTSTKHVHADPHPRPLPHDAEQ